VVAIAADTLAASAVVMPAASVAADTQVAAAMAVVGMAAAVTGK
jgi:hypothetical protein